MPGEGALHAALSLMRAVLIGYARCSTIDQDLTAQRPRSKLPEVEPKRICVDHGMTGTDRARPVFGRRLLPAEPATPSW